MIANLSDAERALFHHGEHGGHKEGASQKTPLTSAEHFLSILLILQSCLNFFDPLLCLGRLGSLARGSIAGGLSSESEFTEILLRK